MDLVDEARDPRLQVAMYVYRTRTGIFYIVLEDFESNFGFPVAVAMDRSEVFPELNRIGFQLNDGEMLKSIDPSVTLRLSRFGETPLDDEETQILRSQINAGVFVTLVTNNAAGYFDETSGEMISFSES